MTEILTPTDAGIVRAGELLAAGALVAFGTETVYGLGADASQGAAVAAIYAAKGRPQFNPLIAHYPSASAAFADVCADVRAEKLAAKFWPGPLTLVLPIAPACRVHELARAGLSTLAVRVPKGEALQALLRAAGRPIAAPSANRSGHVSPTEAAHVLADLDGKIAALLDTGRCEVGLESSVLDLTSPMPVLLRPGAITRDALQAEIGEIALAGAGSSVRAPGMLASHYAPSLKLRLCAEQVAQDEALLAFGPPLAGAALVFQLSETGNLAEAAQNLFAGLRWLDCKGEEAGVQTIAAMPVPDSGLGAAINDRLRRAAAG